MQLQSAMNLTEMLGTSSGGASQMNFTPQWDQKSKATGVIIRLYLENDSFHDVQN